VFNGSSVDINNVNDVGPGPDINIYTSGNAGDNGSVNGNVLLQAESSSGYVGIKTTDPLYPLDVGGIINATSYYVDEHIMNYEDVSNSVGFTGSGFQTDRVPKIIEGGNTMVLDQGPAISTEINAVTPSHDKLLTEAAIINFYGALSLNHFVHVMTTVVNLLDPTEYRMRQFVLNPAFAGRMCQLENIMLITHGNTGSYDTNWKYYDGSTYENMGNMTLDDGIMLYTNFTNWQFPIVNGTHLAVNKPGVSPMFGEYAEFVQLYIFYSII